MNEKIKIPYHIGIIMDGNGRWAKEKNMNRSLGHLEGSKTLKEVALYAFSKGVKVLSVFAFSTENFKRSKEEVDYLMDLFIKMFNKEFKIFNEKNIKVVFSKCNIGLPIKVEESIKKIEEETKNNDGGIFNVCINYGGRREIIDATKKIATKVLNGQLNIDEIDENIFKDNLYNNLSDIDLLIRTGGEYRVSNFMLWQLSYAEIYITDTYFPDFKGKHLDQAILSYNKRDRRYGGIDYEKKNS